MGLTDRQAADLRKEDAVTKAYATMTRHKIAQRSNPGMAFRNGLLEALPELKRDPSRSTRSWTAQVDRHFVTSSSKLSPTASRTSSRRTRPDSAEVMLRARLAKAARLIASYGIGVARDLDLAVHARGKRIGTAPRAAPTVTLVMMSVNPEMGEEDEQQLEVENEQARIIRVRDGSKHQSRVRIEMLPDANFTGLAKSLRLHKPSMLHVTGHGRPDGSIVLRDEEGQAYPMNPEGLAGLFAVHKSTLRLVVLNSCYSQDLAEQVAEDIDCVVGMASERDR